MRQEMSRGRGAERVNFGSEKARTLCLMCMPVVMTCLA